MAIETIEVVIPVNTGTTPPSEFTLQAMNYANQALSYRNLAMSSEQAAAASALAAATSAEELLNLDNFKPKGVLDCSTNPNYPSGIEGDYYIVSVAGKIGGASGITASVGDMILCATPSIAGNHTTVGSNWVHVITNLDGMVVGPSVSTIDNIATYNSTNGKLIKDSGILVSNILTNSNIGINPNQVPRNSDLGDLAFMDLPNNSNKVLKGDGTWGEQIEVISLIIALS
ncbi:hypothetical protein [Fundidesulfovibrio putealis]|uniref:hypothetical protein n=1 Tax=Fundidesulfovibrio putealis TaxID=270496 RepID=UPI0004289F2B|nr:hypothetical protein [Fundidesulfovibrio putealis]